MSHYVFISNIFRSRLFAPNNLAATGVPAPTPAQPAFTGGTGGVQPWFMRKEARKPDSECSDDEICEIIDKYYTKRGKFKPIDEVDPQVVDRFQKDIARLKSRMAELEKKFKTDKHTYLEKWVFERNRRKSLELIMRLEEYIAHSESAEYFKGLADSAAKDAAKSARDAVSASDQTDGKTVRKPDEAPDEELIRDIVQKYASRDKNTPAYLRDITDDIRELRRRIDRLDDKVLDSDVDLDEKLVLERQKKRFHDLVSKLEEICAKNRSVLDAIRETAKAAQKAARIAKAAARRAARAERRAKSRKSASLLALKPLPRRLWREVASVAGSTQDYIAIEYIDWLAVFLSALPWFVGSAGSLVAASLVPEKNKAVRTVLYVGSGTLAAVGVVMGAMHVIYPSQRVEAV